MSNLFGTFSVAQTGLSISKYSIDTVSNNIANKDTDGYKKRVVDQSEIGQYGAITGRGVSMDGVSRVTEQYLYDSYMRESSKTSYYDKLTSMLGTMEDIFAETDTSGFSVDLSNFFDSIESLRTNPSSDVYKSDVQRQGQFLVDTLQRMYSSIQKSQDLEQDQLKTDVDDANDILKQIADVNAKLEKYGDSENDLLDKRDLLERKLSQYVDVDINRVNGYSITIGGVVALSNSTFNQKIEIDNRDLKQVDKFNYIQDNGDDTLPTVLDALKYNADGTKKDAYDENDVITYTLNNDSNLSVSIQIGESVSGDWDNDPSTPDETHEITNSNITRGLVLKINNDPKLNQFVTAYNGDYNDGYTIYEGDDRGLGRTGDKYLRIESNLPGKDNEFTGSINVVRYDGNDTSVDTTDPLNIDERDVIYRNDSESKDAQSDTVLRILNEDLDLTSGSMKAQVDNLSSSSPNNSIQKHLDQLDDLAATISDIYDSYIQIGETDYTYGTNASNDYNNDTAMGNIVSLGLFSGSSVKDLTFNKNAVNNLSQDQIDYLATIQWKTDLSFDGKGQDPSKADSTSLSEFFRNTKVGVSSDTEDARVSQETQANISQSIGESYNKVVAVDEDEEMMNLMKFQAAYSANAQIITAVNQMIQTILGLRQ